MSNLSCGIIGLPNVGKSTLFNALLKKRQAAASNYPFCTIDPNVGVVDLPDPRLAVLAKISKSYKIVPASVTFVDIAGLVRGASKGEGLGNKFLANIRETDAILHVVRCFEDEEITHVEGKVDPIRDIEVIQLELTLSDLQMVENTLQKMERQAKGDKTLLPLMAVLTKAQTHLNQGHLVATLPLNLEEQELIKNIPFLTHKKMIYVTNVSEKDLPEMTNPFVEKVKTFAAKERAEVIPICAKLEEELVALEPEEARAYLEELGLKEPGLDRLIRKSFETLGLITFLTTGEQETRAWTIKQGTPADIAAGKIHSDIQKGFIRAEVINYNDILTYGGRVKAKEAGKSRSEGRDYIVQDGDVILFFHN